MRVLDLFSGIGGFSLGLERAGMETVAFCEYDAKARLVLSKHWPDVPQYTDVRTLTGEQLEKDGIGDIGLICGGYPCQPFSVAGKRQGAEDDRHLWPEFFRLIQEIRPTWVIGENVAGHINMGLDRVLSDLESEGYQSQVFLIPACAVGAPHRRDRVWIVANSGNERVHKRRGYDASVKESGVLGGVFGDGVSGGQKKENDILANTRREHVEGQRPDSDTQGRQGQAQGQAGLRDRAGRSEPGVWLPEPPVGRVANGVPGRVDRLKQLGNAVVPAIPEIIGRAIMEAA